jgi:hypothetical protein
MSWLRRRQGGRIVPRVAAKGLGLGVGDGELRGGLGDELRPRRRAPSCNCGRGGSGGGVPSLDGEVEVVAPLVLYEGLREDEALRAMMLSVGLAKSSCSTRSPSPSFAGVGASPSLGDGWLCGAAFPDSDMEKAGGLSHGA